jgi:hypothetical protein
MKHSEASPEFDPSSDWEYRVHPLRGVSATRAGIVHRVAGGEAVLAWSRVALALAATVGEPEGVSAVVFDLLVERGDSQLVVYRLDAEPHREALPLAVRIYAELGPDRSDASIKAMATEGNPLAWYPDVESFEAAARDRFLKR